MKRPSKSISSYVGNAPITSGNCDLYNPGNHKKLLRRNYYKNKQKNYSGANSILQKSIPESPQLTAFLNWTIDTYLFALSQQVPCMPYTSPILLPAMQPHPTITWLLGQPQRQPAGPEGVCLIRTEDKVKGVAIVGTQFTVKNDLYGAQQNQSKKKNSSVYYLLYIAMLDADTAEDHHPLVLHTMFVSTALANYSKTCTE